MTNKVEQQGRRLIAPRVVLFAAAALLLLCLPEGAAAQWVTDKYGNTTLASGNVGVGTTSPQAIVDSQRNDGLDLLMRVWNTNTMSGTTTFRLANSSNLGSRLQFTDSNSYVSTVAADRTGGLRFRTGNASSEEGLTDRMTISPGGNVGLGTAAPTYLLDISGSTNTPFRVRDSSGREYFSTTTRTGPYPTWTAQVASIAGSRLIVDSTSPDGGNDTLIRRMVNSLIFNPSDHPTLPGAFMVRQVGGYYGLFVDQNTNGNVGIGTTAPASKLHVAGNITVDGNINAKYQDVAEWVPSKQKLQAGTVVVVDPVGVNGVLASASAYDTSVAGVVSAQPGLILGEAGEGKVKVATTGRVKVRVDATRAPIRAGDLLVSGEREGYAMKSEPISVGQRKMHAPGTIIGKALESLEKGTGEILVLLSLQ